MKLRWPIQQLGVLRAPSKHSLVGGPFGSNLVSTDYTNEGIPVIRGGNLPLHTRFSFDDLVFVSEKKADRLTQNSAYPGDLVFTQRGTLGQVGLIPADSPYPRFIVSQSQMKMTVDQTQADPLYLYYFFRLPSTVELILALAITSGIPHINLDILRKFPVPTPPLPTQRKIAAVLAAYDDLIDANRRRIALLERMAEEIYREWFVRLRFPGHEKTKITKGLPDGWERKRVENLTSYLKRGVAPVYDDTASSLAINQKCIRDGKVDLSEARQQSREVAAERYIKRGDILVNSTGEGTLGRVAQVQFSIQNCIVDSHVTIVRPAPGVPRHFLGLTLQAWEPHFATMGRGSTNQTELAPSVIGRVEVMMPSDELTKRFEAIAEPLATQAHVLAQQNAHLQRTRDLLLPRLISGKLPVEALAIAFPPSMAEAAKA